jgi:hypothetical protein
MDDLWTGNDRPIPASYWMAAALGSIVVLFSYATASWVPWFVRDMAGNVPDLYLLGPGLLLSFSAVVGLAFATLPWIAVRWPGLAIALALLPMVPTLIDPQGLAVHFGVFASLCAIVLTGSWRSPRAAVVAAVVAELLIVGWLFSGGSMAAPFRSDVSLDYYTGSRILLGLLYAVAVGLVVLAATGGRRSAPAVRKGRGDFA